MQIKILIYLITWFYQADLKPSINHQVVYKTKHKPILLGELLKGYEGMVITFISPDCPLCQSYTRTLNQLKKTHEKIRFIAIVPGSDKSELEVTSFIKSYDFKLDIYTDLNNQLIKKLQATITPQCFLFDKKGQSLYAGRIDNWAYAVGKKRSVITDYSLKNAINQYLAGKSIIPSHTKAVGCFIE